MKQPHDVEPRARDWTPAAYAGVRALVLGATGFIGRRTVRALTTSGTTVIAVGRDAAALQRLNLPAGSSVMICDLADETATAAVVRAARPAVTFNLAGYGVDRSERDAGSAQRINAELPAQLAALLATAPEVDWSGQTLVHTGSALEYGEASGDLREDTVPLPTTLYGTSKLAGTLAVRERCADTGLRAVSARLFTVYGPGEAPGRLLPSLLAAAQTGTPLALTAGSHRRDFTFVDDAVEGLLRLGVSAAEPGEVVNLATGRLEAVRTFAERAARVLGMDAGLLQFGAVPTRTEEMHHDPVAIDRLRALVGWTPATSIEAGVLQTYRELKRIDAKP